MAAPSARGPGTAVLALSAGLLAAAAALAQLLLAPQVALADNGDFLRLACQLRVEADLAPGAPAFFGHAVLAWRPAPAGPCVGLASSELPLLRLAQALTPGDGRVDLRVVGAVHAVLLGVCVAALLAALLGALPGRARVRLAVVAGVLAVLLDSSRTAYLASLYSEPVSLLALLLLLAAVAVSWRLPVPPGAVLVTLAALPLVLSKPQHAPLAAVVGALLVTRALVGPSAPGARSAGSQPGRRRLVPALALTGVLAAALLGAAAAYLRDVPPELRRPNTYNIVFYEVLAHSDDPAADARELGVDPDLVRYARTSYFGTPEATGPRFDAFFATVGSADVVRFYARHPQRAASLYARAARDSFDWLPGYLGTFPAGSGRPDVAQSCRPCVLERLAARSAPAAPVLLLALWAGAAAAGVALLRSGGPADQGLAASLLLLDGVAVAGFGAATLGSGDYELVKHLFLVGVADGLLVVLGAATAVRLAHARRPA